MANLKEQEKWEDGIYQIEENDPVLGGAEGITNRPAKQLANRTAWLKKVLSLLGLKAQPKTITATSDNGFDETGHTHQIDKASLTQQGIVQLNSATNSDNETMAATPKAVKTAYDLANGKQSPATTLAGYGIGNFKVEPFVGNLNTLKTDGVYAITQASRSQNLPVSTSCQIEVIAGGDGAWCRQLAYVAYSTDVYERHQTSYQTDSWSPWVKIDSLDKIPNSKKSSAINSNSADTVATSVAVKTAYDKGVEAKTAADGAQRTANEGVSKATTAQNTANSAVTKADNAQRAADNANSNANERVLKSGDTMTGNLTVPKLIVNDPTNNNNFVQIGDDTKLIDVDISHTVGLQTTDNANDAYIAYGVTKKRFGFDGVNFKAESGIAAQWYQSDAKGHGAFGAQWRDKTAPYVVHNPNANGSNAYFPFLKGFNSNGTLYGTAFSFGYMTPGHINQFGSGVIHLIEDNGSEKYWWFDHDGKLRADEFEAKGKRLSKAHQSDDKYVDVASQDNYGGLRIRKPDGKLMIFEREGDKFKYWAQDLYEIYLPQKSGTLMLDSDISYQKIGNFEIRRYPDGTMIQTYFVDFYDVHGQNSGLGGAGQKQLTWAVSFIEKPLVWGNITSSIEDHHDAGVNILTKSTGTTLYWYNYEHGNPNQGACRLQFLAIGRWK